MSILKQHSKTSKAPKTPKAPKGSKVAAPSKKSKVEAPSPFDDELTVVLGFDANFFQITTAADLHVGTREYQQDALYVTPTVRSSPDDEVTKAFGVLCDGMGGLENGEKASQMAVKQLTEDLEAFENNSENNTEVAAFFEQEVEKIDRMVFEEVGEGKRDGAGTTLTAALILDKELYWTAVGDSRIYIIRNDEILQVTTDHNYMMLLLDDVKRGRMTYEDAKNHPNSGALISFIGSGKVKYINVNREPFRLMHGDIVLLCSDGLTKSLSNDEIKEIIMEHYGDMKEAAHRLTLQAFDTGDGSKDNTSVILMQYFE